MKSQHKSKVFVAMSGGVDSSVAAALLKKQGYEVIGVFMKPWSRFASNENSTSKSRIPDSQSESGQPFCLWQQDREDALRAAAVLGIPLLTWDFSKEYKKEVADYMIREYRAGRTPNPDVMCNKHIKFGLFLKRALKEGADYIATGHYVKKLKIKNEKFKIIESDFKLFQAKDNNKDQSYFLWTLTKRQLKHCLFPIGDYIKPEVRKIAKKFSLPNYDKKDSQGVCFIGPLDMKNFLKNYIKPKSGKILNLKGKELGKHDGVYYYTIGQRHGLNIGNGQGPYSVTAKDIKKNIIYVGKEKDLAGREIKISDVNWISQAPKLPAKISVKIRYRSESVPATIFFHYSGYKLKARSHKLFNSVTPGQSAVFYKGEELLGGGIIDG